MPRLPATGAGVDSTPAGVGVIPASSPATEATVGEDVGAAVTSAIAAGGAAVVGAADAPIISRITGVGAMDPAIDADGAALAVWAEEGAVGAALAVWVEEGVGAADVMDEDDKDVGSQPQDRPNSSAVASGKDASPDISPACVVCFGFVAGEVGREVGR